MFSKGGQIQNYLPEKNNTDGGPPWDTETYCELYHCFVRKQWSNTIIDMQADLHTNINTDRNIIAIKVRQRLKAREEPNREPTLKGIKPEKEGQSKEEALENYNIKFRELVNEAWDKEDYNTVSFHNFKSQIFKLRVSNPKTFFCIFIRTMSNFKWPEGLALKNTFEIVLIITIIILILMLLLLLLIIIIIVIIIKT